MMPKAQYGANNAELRIACILHSFHKYLCSLFLFSGTAGGGPVNDRIDSKSVSPPPHRITVDPQRSGQLKAEVLNSRASVWSSKNSPTDPPIRY